MEPGQAFKLQNRKRIMRIEKYDIALNLLTEDKLEMVRNWRNDPKIVKYMEFKEYITPQMQLDWFTKINNGNNFYFIIEHNEREIGLTNVRDIDFEIKQGEAGIFIYDDEFLNSTVSTQATLCLYDFCFETLDLNSMVAHVLKENKRSIRFIKMFGYKLSQNQDDVDNQEYILTSADYFKNRAIISRIF
jgi:UDP-4-amino-4,6-dideoxy-N-acetyl-beta-L-altrosamine N-acetyltransferase